MIARGPAPARRCRRSRSPSERRGGGRRQYPHLTFQPRVGLQKGVGVVGETTAALPRPCRRVEQDVSHLPEQGAVPSPRTGRRPGRRRTSSRAAGSAAWASGSLPGSAAAREGRQLLELGRRLGVGSGRYGRPTGLSPCRAFGWGVVGESSSLLAALGDGLDEGRVRLRRRRGLVVVGRLLVVVLVADRRRLLLDGRLLLEGVSRTTARAAARRRFRCGLASGLRRRRGVGGGRCLSGRGSFGRRSVSVAPSSGRSVESSPSGRSLARARSPRREPPWALRPRQRPRRSQSRTRPQRPALPPARRPALPLVRAHPGALRRRATAWSLSGGGDLGVLGVRGEERTAPRSLPHMDFFFFGVGSVVERDAVEEGAAGGRRRRRLDLDRRHGLRRRRRRRRSGGWSGRGVTFFSSTAAGASYFAQRLEEPSPSQHTPSVASIESSLAGLCFS